MFVYFQWAFFLDQDLKPCPRLFYLFTETLKHSVYFTLFIHLFPAYYLGIRFYAEVSVTDALKAKVLV